MCTTFNCPPQSFHPRAEPALFPTVMPLFPHAPQVTEQKQARAPNPTRTDLGGQHLDVMRLRRVKWPREDAVVRDFLVHSYNVFIVNR